MYHIRMAKYRAHKDRGPSMTRLVAKRQEEITELCQRYRVKELFLFGSAATGEFHRTRSDVDFLIRFQPCTASEHADRYFGMLAALQDLFDRRIDLVEIGAVKNPYFREAAQANSIRLYAA